MAFVFNLSIIIIDQILLFIINILVARNTGEALYGNFSVATQGLLIFGTLLTLGLDSIIDYYIPKLHHMRHYKKILSLMTSIKRFMLPIYLGVFVSGLSILILFILDISPNLNHEVLVHPFYLFIWGAVFIACYNILIHLMRSINQMRLAVNMSLFQNVAYLLLVCLLIELSNLYLGDEKRGFYPHVLLVAFVASYGLTCLISYLLLNQTGNRQKKIYTEKPIKWHGKIHGYTIQNLNAYIYAAIPLFVLEIVSKNEHYVGLFAAVTSIISVSHLAIYPLGILIAPEISRALNHSSRQLRNILASYLKLCLLTSMTVVLIIGCFAKPILLLFKSDFIDALPYLYISLIAIITYGVNLPLAKVVMFSNNGNQIGAKLTLSLLGIQLIASFILIRQWDIVGAVICFNGASLLNSLALIVLSRNILITPKNTRQFLTELQV